MRIEHQEARRELEALLIANGVWIDPGATILQMLSLAEVHGLVEPRPVPTDWPSLSAA